MVKFTINFDFNFRRDHQTKFLWTSRLWVCRRKEHILGYVPKNYEKIIRVVKDSFVQKFELTKHKISIVSRQDKSKHSNKQCAFVTTPIMLTVREVKYWWQQCKKTPSICGTWQQIAITTHTALKKIKTFSNDKNDLLNTIEWDAIINRRNWKSNLTEFSTAIYDQINEESLKIA